MKKLILLAAGLLFLLQANAQADSLIWVKEINEQVWTPFISHFISGNNVGFRNVHSKRVTRVEIDRGVVMDYEKYFPAADSGSPLIKKAENRLFELRFDKRVSKGTKAWESGFYRGGILQQGKAPRYYYGRFFVVLEKEKGTWKIIVDADTHKEANEENFNKAFAME